MTEKLVELFEEQHEADKAAAGRRSHARAH
jgi:hypothetical protein